MSTTSTGAASTGAVATVIGVALLMIGALLVFTGPIAQGEAQEQSGPLGLWSESSGSASFNAIPILGFIMAIVGALVLIVGLKGLMHSFERGKDRAG